MDFKKISGLLMAVLTSMAMSPAEAVDIADKATLENYLNGAETEGVITATISETIGASLPDGSNKNLTGGAITRSVSLNVNGAKATLDISNTSIGSLISQATAGTSELGFVIDGNVNLTGGQIPSAIPGAAPTVESSVVLAGNNSTRLTVNDNAKLVAQGDINGLLSYTQSANTNVQILKTAKTGATDGNGSLSAKENVEVNGGTLTVDESINVTEGAFSQKGGSTVTIKGQDANNNSLSVGDSITIDEESELKTEHTIKTTNGTLTVDHNSKITMSTASAKDNNIIINGQDGDGNSVFISNGSVVDLGKTKFTAEENGNNLLSATGNIVLSDATIKRANITTTSDFKAYDGAKTENIGNLEANNVLLGDVGANNFDGDIKTNALSANSYSQNGGSASIGVLKIKDAEQKVTLNKGTLTVGSSDGEGVDYEINGGTFNLEKGTNTGKLVVKKFTNAEGSKVNLGDGTTLNATDAISFNGGKENGGQADEVVNVVITGDTVSSDKSISMVGNIKIGNASTIESKVINLGDGATPTHINTERIGGKLVSTGTITANKNTTARLSTITSDGGTAKLVVDGANLTVTNIGEADATGNAKSLASYKQTGGNVSATTLYVGGSSADRTTKDLSVTSGGALTVGANTNPTYGILSVGGNVSLEGASSLKFISSGTANTMSVGGVMTVDGGSNVAISQSANAIINEINIANGNLTAEQSSKIKTNKYTQGVNAGDVNVYEIELGNFGAEYQINGGNFTATKLSGTLSEGTGSKYTQTGGTANIGTITNIYDVSLGTGDLTVKSATVAHDTNVNGGNFATNGAYTTTNKFLLQNGTVTVSGDDAILTAGTYEQQGSNSYADVNNMKVNNAFVVRGENGVITNDKTQFKLSKSLTAKTVRFENIKDKDGNDNNAVVISGNIEATDTEADGVTLAGADVHLVSGGMKTKNLTLGAKDGSQSVLYISDGASIDSASNISLNDASQIVGEGAEGAYHGSINNAQLVYNQSGEDSNTNLKTLTAKTVTLSNGTMDIENFTATDLNVTDDAKSFTLGSKGDVKNLNLTGSETNDPRIILKDNSTLNADKFNFSVSGIVDNGAGERADAAVLIGTSYLQRNNNTVFKVANMAASEAGKGDVDIQGGTFDVGYLGMNNASTYDKISAFNRVAIGSDTLKPQDVNIGQIYTKTLEIKNSGNTNVIGTVNDDKNTTGTKVAVTGGETLFTGGVNTADYTQSNYSTVSLDGNAYIKSTGNISLTESSEIVMKEGSKITSASNKGASGLITINDSRIHSATGEKLGSITSGINTRSLAYKQLGDSSSVTVKEIDLQNGQLQMGDAEGTSGGTITADKVSANKIKIYNGTVTVGDANTAGIFAADAAASAYTSSSATIEVEGGTLNLYGSMLKASVATSTSTPVVKLAAEQINLYSAAGNNVNRFGQFEETSSGGTVEKTIYRMQIGDASDGHGRTEVSLNGDNTGLQITSGGGHTTLTNALITLGNVNQNLELVTNGGNIEFVKTASTDASISNGENGTITIKKGSNHKTGTSVILSNVNSNRQGTIDNQGETIIRAGFEDENGNITNTNVYANEYLQTNGDDNSKTTVQGNAKLDAETITINKGEFEISTNGTVSADNFTAKKTDGENPTISTTRNDKGTDDISAITANIINLTNTNVNVRDNSVLNFTLIDPNTTGSAVGNYNNVTATIGQNGKLEFLAEKDGFTNTVKNSTFTLADGSASSSGAEGGMLAFKGETEIIGTTIDGGTKSNITFDSTKGDITVDNTSKITANGTLTITDTNTDATKPNTVTINTDINKSGTKKGDIVKEGKNTLVINGNAYGNTMNVSDGKVSLADGKKIDMAGDIKIAGSEAEDRTVKVDVGAGSVISSKGVISLGDQGSEDFTNINLAKGSKISGASKIYIDANVNMNGATIESTGTNTDDGVTVGGGAKITTGINSGESKIKGSTITITKGSTITIKSGSSLVYDGEVQSDAHYDVDQGAYLEIDPGTYAGSDYKGNGAIIHNESSGAKDASGAKGTVGVLVSKGNTTFENGQATNTDATDIVNSGNGGAIYNGYELDDTTSTPDKFVPATIEFEGGKVTFRKNTANVNGGAISNFGNMYVSSANDVASNNFVFEGNKAGYRGETALGITGGGKGGAIYNSETEATDGAITTTIKGEINFGKKGTTTFTDNKSTQMGGAIYNDSSSDSAITLGKVIFTGNSSKLGGAIYTKAGNITIGDNAQFSVNKSSVGGGAIYMTGTDTKIKMGSGAIFDRNASEAAGGAIYTDNIGGGSTLDLAQATFVGNTAGSDGGAIANKGTINITDQTKFTSNTASARGGAIFNQGTLNVENGTVFGGASAEGEESKGNSALEGGAIYNDGGTLNIDKKVSFTGNKAEAGGAIFSRGSDVTLEGVSFTENKAEYINNTKDLKGGAIYFKNGKLNLFGDNTFEGNYITSSKSAQGGAIYGGDGAVISIEGTTLRGNTVSVDGGKESLAQGGAIYVGNGASLSIKDKDSTGTYATTITDNSATRGGALYVANGGSFTLGRDAEIKGNTAHNGATATVKGLGGGLYIEDGATINFLGAKEAKFTSNVAESRGGAIFNAGYLDLKNNALGKNPRPLIFKGNQAGDAGAAIYNLGEMDLTGGWAFFGKGNKTYGGGNIFSGNKGTSAVANSGILRLVDGFEFYYDPDISSVVANSGALWNESYVDEDGVRHDGKMYFTTGSAVSSDNDAGDISFRIGGIGDGTVNGAGLHITGDSVIYTDGAANVINNAILTGNNGLLGGGLYVDRSKGVPDSEGTTPNYVEATKYTRLDIDNTKFTENVANGKGGAIYNRGTETANSRLNISNSTTFTKNSANVDGGAIYNDEYGVILFENGYVFANADGQSANVAGNGGGAIANKGKVVFVLDEDTQKSVTFTHQGSIPTNPQDPASAKKYTSYGGALYLDEGGTVSTIINGTEQENKLINALFDNNEAVNGGALANIGSNLTVKKTLFDSNKATTAGGAAYIKSTTQFYLTNDYNFVNNIVEPEVADPDNPKGSGGAIFNTTNTTVATEEDTMVDGFVGNKASYVGGAIAHMPEDKNADPMTIKGNIRFKENEAQFGGAIYSSGQLVLDADKGNIEFVDNKASGAGSAIYLYEDSTSAGGATLVFTSTSDGDVNKDSVYGVTFKDKYTDANGVEHAAQTIAGGGNKTKVNVLAGNVNFESDASGLKSMYYQTGGTVTVKNKFINIVKPDGMETHHGVKDGTIILDDGAILTSNNLKVENERPTLKTANGGTEAKIIFKKNEKSHLSDVSALYKGSGKDTFTYSHDEEVTDAEGNKTTQTVSNTITLTSADVEIDGETLTLDKDVEIGVDKKNQNVRDLTLGEGVTMASKVTVNGGTASERAARLILKDGVHTGSNAGAVLNGYNAELSIANETTNLVFEQSLQSKGTDAQKETQKVTKIGKGSLTFKGNELKDFGGTYIQGLDTVNNKIVETGTVRFTDSFFDKDTAAKAKFYAGVLQLDNGITFEDGTVIDLAPSDRSSYLDYNKVANATLSTSIKSELDFRNGTPDRITLTDKNDNKADVIGISKGGKLQINDNSTIYANETINVGETFAPEAIKSLGLGGEAAKDSNGVQIRTDSDKLTFVVKNENNTKGTGILGLGETTVVIGNASSADKKIIVPTVDLAENTQLEIKSGLYKKANERYVQVNVGESGNVAKGDIVKTGDGDITIVGDKSNFEGNLVIKNGQLKVGHLETNPTITVDENGKEVITNGTIAMENGKNTIADGDRFKSGTKIDLKYVEDGAVTVVGNVTEDEDLNILDNIGNDGTIGSETAENAKAKYNLTVDNTDRDGDIVVGVDGGGTIYVRNGQSVSMSAGVNANGDNSKIIADTLTIDGKTSSFNLLTGDMRLNALNMSANTVFNAAGGKLNTVEVNKLTLNGDANFTVDLDPAKGKSDKFKITQVVSDTARNINISKWNLLNDPVAGSKVYDIFVGADDKALTEGTNYKFTTSVSEVQTPIADYKFGSVTTTDGKTTGQYRLTRTGYSPTAHAVPVALQSSYITQLGTYDMAFSNFDTVMALPTTVGSNRPNQYAVSDVDETIVYSPLYIPELDKGAWFRPYGNFESLKFKGGVRDVDYQSYGGFVGGDTALVQLGESPYQGTMSAYVGYTGAHQDSSGASGTSNGGSIGVTGSIYRGNFFSGLTVNANASIADISTPFGGTDFFMLGVGVASKTGYNWELGNGRFIIQPSWLMSYSFVNAFDPGTIAGYKIDSDALHGVQLTPQLKFIANLPQGWQPYLLVNFRWNVTDDAGVKLASSTIPDVALKSYVEYGLGMQKRWGERFTGYGQFLGRGGGRTGVGLNLGLRWAVGQGR